MALDQDFHRLEQKVQRLGTALERVVAERNRALAENQALREEVAQKNRALERSEQTVSQRSAGERLSGLVEDKQALRRQLDELIAEIDECLELLSD